MQLRVKKSMRRSGFTLIEIIVSVTLLLLLSGLFIANYTEFRNSQTVKQSASDLISNLQAVRTMASAGVKPSGCDTLVGYAVEFTADAYTASAVCQDGDEYPPVTYTLPANVTFSPIPDAITFYALNRGASADQTITITRAGTTMKMKVSVFTSGVVSDYISTSTPGLTPTPTPTGTPAGTPTPTSTPTPTPTPACSGFCFPPFYNCPTGCECSSYQCCPP
jgi:prepilin-type N-terminal cleavage/methylation domain-containing protein